MFIFFDAGFTLLRPTPSVGWHYAEVAARYGIHATAEELDPAFLRAWKRCKRESPAHPAVPYGITAVQALAFWSNVVRHTFTEAGHDFPTDETYYREVFDLFAEPRCWELYPDVLPAFAALEARGIPFGVLSNWDARLWPVLAGHGILPRLAALLISSEVGAEKPSPEIFSAAQKAAGDGPSALIGDEPEADGHGAIRAGWQQCLVLRNQGAEVPAGLRGEKDLLAAVEALLDSVHL